MPKPIIEMNAIDPGDRRIANIHTAPFRTLFSDGVADGEVLQLDTNRPLGTGFHLYRMPHIPNQAALSSCLPQISARQTTNNWRLDQLAGVGLRGETSDNPMIMTASEVQTHPEWLSANSTNPQITPAIVTRYPVWLAKIGPAN